MNRKTPSSPASTAQMVTKWGLHILLTVTPLPGVLPRQHCTDGDQVRTTHTPDCDTLTRSDSSIFISSFLSDSNVVHLQLFFARTAHLLWTLNLQTRKEKINSQPLVELLHNWTEEPHHRKELSLLGEPTVDFYPCRIRSVKKVHVKVSIIFPGLSFSSFYLSHFGEHLIKKSNLN